MGSTFLGINPPLPHARDRGSPACIWPGTWQPFHLGGSCLFQFHSDAQFPLSVLPLHKPTQDLHPPACPFRRLGASSTPTGYSYMLGFLLL